MASSPGDLSLGCGRKPTPDPPGGPERFERSPTFHGWGNPIVDSRGTGAAGNPSGCRGGLLNRKNLPRRENYAQSTGIGGSKGIADATDDVLLTVVAERLAACT